MKMNSDIIKMKIANGGELNEEFQDKMLEPVRIVKKEFHDLLKENKDNLHVNTIF